MPICIPSGFSGANHVAMHDLTAADNTPGQTVEKEVEGTRVVVTVKKGPDCGYLVIAVDGQRTNPTEINTYDRQVDWNHRIIAAENLSPGKHRVVVTALGRMDQASANSFVQVVGIDGE